MTKPFQYIMSKEAAPVVFINSAGDPFPEYSFMRTEPSANYTASTIQSIITPVSTPEPTPFLYLFAYSVVIIFLDRLKF